MPPYLDIYGLTRHRDAATIDRFLNAYVDRMASEDRGDEELLIGQLQPVPSEASSEVFAWEPSLTLSHIIELGLAFIANYNQTAKPFKWTYQGRP